MHPLLNTPEVKAQVEALVSTMTLAQKIGQMTLTERLNCSPSDAKKFHIGSAKGFKLLSDLWLRSGWDVKHVYSFSWLGRPIIQLPEDMMRLQEVIYKLKPNLIIETGVAHGGGLVFYANIMSSYCKPKIIGVDIEIREHNFKAIKNDFC